MATWLQTVTKWTDGRVPFFIDSENDAFRTKFLLAAETFNADVSREMWVHFEDADKAKAENANYVIVKHTDKGGHSECNGRKSEPGSQSLAVSGLTGVMLHEMMHAVGFQHEQFHRQFCSGLAPEAKTFTNEVIRGIREGLGFDKEDPKWRKLRNIVVNNKIENDFFVRYLSCLLESVVEFAVDQYVAICNKYAVVVSTDPTYPDWQSIMFYHDYIKAAKDAVALLGRAVPELPGLADAVVSNYESNAEHLSHQDVRSVNVLYS